MNEAPGSRNPPRRRAIKECMLEITGRSEIKIQLTRDTPDASWTGMVYNDSCTVVYGVSIANTLTICNGKEEKRLL